MALPRGIQALELTGTYAKHSTAFQQVADRMECMISSRAVGKYATGLLEEGYSTKGFHNKAKSSNWGPMAGFVLSDPRFTKRGGSQAAREAQRRDIFKAFGAGTTEVPLYISEKRRKDLMQAPLNCMRRGWNVDEENHYYFADSPDGQLFLFYLSSTTQAPGAQGRKMWLVQYALTERALPTGLNAPTQAQGLDYLPVMAMVDTDCPALVKVTCLAATTGDYDLFCVFPARQRYARGTQDRRMVSGSDRFRAGIQQFKEQESPEVGNITPRVRQVMNQVNVAANHPGGPIVHHSDEAGRPLVSEMDFPIIAWVPKETQPYGIRNAAEFREFIGELAFKYQMVLNPGWFRELGYNLQKRHGMIIGVSRGGSYEV
jgi:hypothetical protein